MIAHELAAAGAESSEALNPAAEVASSRTWKTENLQQSFEQPPAAAAAAAAKSTKSLCNQVLKSLKRIQQTCGSSLQLDCNNTS
jgi:hypothetical protein